MEGRQHFSHGRQVIAGTVGNIMEWYDFAVYGYFVSVIAKRFFPANDPTSSLIAAFGAFSAGFLMRPFGGLLFGYIGDRVGRKAALTFSVVAMAIPTFLIGLLPDYSTIGVAAPVLLVLCRMVQGLSVGGEYTTSVVYLVEGAPPNRRGLAGNWSGFGATTGTLLGSAVGAVLTSVLDPETMQNWGWRLPFLLGLLVGVGGLMVRHGLPEPVAPVKEGSPPVVEAFRTQWRAILQVVGLSVLMGVAFYLIFVYLVTYYTEIDHLKEAVALKINTASMVLLLATQPFVAVLSDRVGRRPVLLAGCLGLLVAAYPLFWLLHHGNFWLVLGGQFGFAVLAATYNAVVPVTMVEAFPVKGRCTAIAVSYNLSLGLIGGTSPMVATYLIHRTHDDLSPAYYLMAAAAVSLVAVLTLRETSREPLR
ncbi:MAG: MFS transporter [Gemmata sp.]